MLVMGEKDAAAEKVSVRRQGEGDLGQQSVKEFLDNFKIWAKRE